MPLQAHVTNLDASPYVGRIAICRIRNGTIKRGEQIAWSRHDGSIERVKVTELYITEALDRVPAESAGPGEIIAVAGIPEITIGDTLTDPENPKPLPVITVDEPSLSVTIGTNDSPLAGQDGDKLTASQVQGSGSSVSWSATSRCVSTRQSAPTSGRSRAAASWRSRYWSS